jgi:ubiquinone/menaquinone biosynthesis C-methylase UbiE
MEQPGTSEECSRRGLAPSCAAEFDSLAEFFDQLPIAAENGPERFCALRPSGNLRALDVGCGTGNTLLALAPYFESIVGVDLSTNMLRLASRKIIDNRIRNVSLARMEASELGFSTGTFDYVVSHTALHHSGDLGAVLRELGRVVSPGGRLIVVDIVGPSLLPPKTKMRISSAVDLIHSFALGKLVSGVERFRAANHPAWLSHLRKERFLPSTTFETVARTTLPGARFEHKRREFWTTKYVIMRWDRPRD